MRPICEPHSILNTRDTKFIECLRGNKRSLTICWSKGHITLKWVLSSQWLKYMRSDRNCNQETTRLKDGGKYVWAEARDGVVAAARTEGNVGWLHQLKTVLIVWVKWLHGGSPSWADNISWASQVFPRTCNRKFHYNLHTINPYKKNPDKSSPHSVFLVNWF